MTRKQLETMREIRLWGRQIIVPICGVMATALTIPEVRQAVAEKFKHVTRPNRNKED